MMKELIGFPLIRRQSGVLEYGGSQKWFRRRFARLTGCASVTAANLAAYYQLGIKKPDSRLPLTEELLEEEDVSIRDVPTPAVYSFNEYLELMNRMFQVMKPGLRGFPDRDLYETRFLSYAESLGRPFRGDHLQGWSNPDEALRFVKRHLEAEEPVALLILTHADKSIDDETWHWMTITGYDEKAHELLISNYGRRQILSADVVFASHPRNDVKLTAFSPV